MDASRLVQLLVITLFSAAIALIGLNELSHRFMKTGVKDEENQIGHRLVKELSGEVNVLQPLAGRPTAAATPVVPENQNQNQSEQAYMAVQSRWQKIVDKLVPK